MNTRLICAAAAAVFMAWAPAGSAQRQVVALPGAVNALGVLNGVDTQNDATLSVGNQNINTSNDAGGGFRTNVGGTGAILFGGNSTVTGDTGQVGTLYRNVSAGAAGTTVIFNGAIFSTTFTISGTGTANFNGNVISAPDYAADGFINLGAGRTLTGAITTATANTGTLTFNAGSNVVGAIGGANGLKQINVVGGNAAATGAVRAQGFSLGTNTFTITGALTPNAGATFATSFAGNAVFGNINALGNSNVTSPVTVIPTVGGPLTLGTTYLIVNGTAGGTPGTAVVVINNDPRFTFVGVPVNIEGDVRIRLAAAATLAAPGAPPAAAGVGPILIAAPAAPGSDLLAVQAALFALPIGAINNALGHLAPSPANLAAPWVAAQATRQFEDVWMARAEEIQDLCCDACAPNQSNAPVNTHKCKGSERSNWWGKAFGSWGRQGDADGFNGYKTRAAGLMLAWDTPLSNRTRIGLGGGYAYTTIDGNDSTGRTKVDSYQLTGYLSHAAGPWYVHGALTAGVDDYNGSRDIVFPGVNRTANSDYSGRQYAALVTGGKHFYFSQATTVTPFAGLQVSRIRVGGYTESGAGDVNLRVNSQDYDFVQSSLGVKAERVIRTANGTYSPEVHFKWLHDFKSTTMLQTAAFTGGGGTFTAQGVNQDRDLYNIGAGVTFLGCRCGEQTWTVKGLYDYKWNQSSYSSHQLSVIASIKF